MSAPDLGACISAGIAGLTKNFITHVVASLLVGIVSNISFGLLSGPMVVGYMKMVKKEDEGGTAEIGDVFKGFDDFVPALVSALVGGIIVTIGFFLCIIPGLLLMALIPCAAYLVATGEKDGINALKRAWPPIKANLVMAALSMLVLGIIGQIGIIACFIGILITLPVSFIGMYHLAKQLNDDAVAKPVSA